MYKNANQIFNLFWQNLAVFTFQAELQCIGLGLYNIVLTKCTCILAEWIQVTQFTYFYNNNMYR